MRETHLDLESLANDRIDVRPCERTHRAARKPRRGRAVRPPGHLPELVLRAAPAAARGGRLRLSGIGSNAGEHHQRQDHPPARRRRAVRPPLRRASQPRARARPPKRRPPSHRRVGVARGGRRSRPLHSARLLRAAGCRRDPLRGRAAGGTGPRGHPVRARRQRARTRPLLGSRASATLDSPLRSEEHSSYEQRVVLVHSTK